MFRQIETVRLKDVTTGDERGYHVHIGCMDFYVPSEDEARRVVIAYANDPEGYERDFYIRQSQADEIRALKRELKDQRCMNGERIEKEYPRDEEVSQAQTSIPTPTVTRR